MNKGTYMHTYNVSSFTFEQLKNILHDIHHPIHQVLLYSSSTGGSVEISFQDFVKLLHRPEDWVMVISRTYSIIQENVRNKEHLLNRILRGEISVAIPQVIYNKMGEREYTNSLFEGTPYERGKTVFTLTSLIP